MAGGSVVCGVIVTEIGSGGVSAAMFGLFGMTAGSIVLVDGTVTLGVDITVVSDSREASSPTAGAESRTGSIFGATVTGISESFF